MRGSTVHIELTFCALILLTLKCQEPLPRHMQMSTHAYLINFFIALWARVTKQTSGSVQRFAIERFT